LGIYEYYSNGAWPDLHRLYPELAERTVQMYYRAGARYFATQPGTGFATNGLNLYVLARLLWDHRTSANEAVGEYCRHGFGRAAAPVRRFLSAFAERWRRTGSGTRLPAVPENRMMAASLYSESFLAARKRNLEAAAKKAGGDGDILARIHFLEKGLEYTWLYCRAVRATLAVSRTAGTPTLRDAGPSREVSAAAKGALALWDSYWAFVRANLGTFTFGDFWVCYRPGLNGERDPLLAQLRRLAGGSAASGRP